MKRSIANAIVGLGLSAALVAPAFAEGAQGQMIRRQAPAAGYSANFNASCMKDGCLTRWPSFRHDKKPHIRVRRGFTV